MGLLLWNQLNRLLQCFHGISKEPMWFFVHLHESRVKRKKCVFALYVQQSRCMFEWASVLFAPVLDVKQKDVKRQMSMVPLCLSGKRASDQGNVIHPRGGPSKTHCTHIQNASLGYSEEMPAFLRHISTMKNPLDSPLQMMFDTVNWFHTSLNFKAITSVWRWASAMMATHSVSRT